MNKQSKILVTGATGLVGSTTVLALLKSGFSNVKAVVRSEKALEVLKSSLLEKLLNCDSLEVVIGECENFNFCDEITLGCDVVVHCAAKVSFEAKDSTQIISTNLVLTQNIVEAAQKNGVSKFIHISSIATLGNVLYPDIANENSLFSTAEGKSAYSISKFYSENVVWRAISEGLNGIILSPAVILSNNHSPKGSGSIAKFASSASPLYCEGITGYVMVQDVANAIVKVIEGDFGIGQRYILCSENLSFKELIARSCFIYGKKEPKFKVSKSLLCLIKRVVKFLNSVGVQTTLTPSIIDNLIDKRLYNGAKFAKDFNFKYTPILESF